MKKSLKRQLILGLVIVVALRIAQQLTLWWDYKEKIPENANTDQLRELSDNKTVQGLLDVIDELEE